MAKPISFFAKPIAALCILVALAACETISAVGPGPVEIGKVYAVNTGKVWSKFPGESRTHRVASMTIDGQRLNSLDFFDGLKPGQSIVYTADRDKLIPKYQADMSANELADFILDSYAVQGLANPKTTSLQPEPFDQMKGYRLEFTGAYRSGLVLRGVAKYAVREDRLYMIIFYAPEEYYYGLHENEVNALLASATLR